MENLLTDLSNVTDSHDASHRLDHLLATRFLEIQLAEMQSKHFHRGNPTLYTGEAVFGIISLFLRDFTPIANRFDSAISRLKSIPHLLAQGETNVRSAPKEWTQKAIRECTGTIHFLENGINQIMQSQQVTSSALRSATQIALSAFQEHKEHLSNELLQHPNNEHGCGKEFYDLLIQKGHCLEMSAEQVNEYALQRVAQLQEELKHEALRFNNEGNAQKVLTRLEDYHPSEGELLQSFEKLWQECVRIATEQGLVNWPNYSLRYTFIPAHFREASPFLYFLPYRAPPAFDPISTYDYLVSPIEPSMPADERERRIRSMNYSVIKLNHVVHHGSIGHHLQNYYAYRAESRVGQVAAVDSASRIAMFCAGTMAEGWACYATSLMRETGFYTDLENFAQLHSQLRQAARSVADSNLHLGKFTFTEAAQFYSTQVGMSHEAARSEVTKNSMFPATAAMYLLGADAIQKLRVISLKRTSSSLMQFHDRFLKYGSVPVSLVAREMLGSNFSLID